MSLVDEISPKDRDATPPLADEAKTVHSVSDTADRKAELSDHVARTPTAALQKEVEAGTEDLQSAKPANARSLQAHIRRLLLLVLGSVAGTVILAIQTYILHQQTLLLAAQTDLLGIDQSVHIRERIVAASGVEDIVRRLVSALKSEANIQIEAPRAFGVLKVNNFTADACESPACANATMDSVLRTINERGAHLDPSPARGIVRLSAFLGHVENTMRPLLDAPHELDLNGNKQDNLGSLQALVTSGITQCFFDPAKGRDLSQNMARLRLVSANAFWVVQPVAAPLEFRDFVKRFPQVGVNTESGILKLGAAVDEVIATAGRDQRHATILDFTTILANGYNAALAGLVDLDRSCTETIDHDSADLKRISSGGRR